MLRYREGCSLVLPRSDIRKRRKGKTQILSAAWPDMSVQTAALTGRRSVCVCVQDVSAGGQDKNRHANNTSSNDIYLLGIHVCIPPFASEIFAKGSWKCPDRVCLSVNIWCDTSHDDSEVHPFPEERNCCTEYGGNSPPSKQHIGEEGYQGADDQSPSVATIYPPPSHGPSL